MEVDSLEVARSRSELLLVQTRGAEWTGGAERTAGLRVGTELTACTSQQVNCLQNNRHGSGICHTPD